MSWINSGGHIFIFLSLVFTTNCSIFVSNSSVQLLVTRGIIEPSNHSCKNCRVLLEITKPFSVIVVLDLNPGTYSTPDGL